MLKIEIQEQEFFDDVKNEFIEVKPTTIHLEHSLYSLAQWESKYHKPFLEIAASEMKSKELYDYISFMAIEKDIPNETFLALTKEQVEQIRDYIADPMTATTFHTKKGKVENDVNAGMKKHEIITAEVIYYWMVELGIPSEYQYWHLNRLLTLVKVCSIKNSDKGSGNKMNKRDAMAFNRSLMASRRSKFKKGGH